MMRKRLTVLLILFCFIGYNLGVCAEQLKYPDFAYEFLGADKHENYNRKMFNFDRGLNKYVIRPIHILWATILPQYVMDRIFGVSNNFEYPIRCVSSLVQKDFHNAGNETKRFLVNTTIGLAGMFDPARHLLKIERSTDNMDKAFARRNIKSGTFFVAPVIAFTTVRDLFGRLFDVALNPTTYIATPVFAIIKAGITINRTSYIQTLVQIVESSYADPYEITKKAFGINGYIRKNNFDRVQILSSLRAETLPNDEENLVPISDKKSDNAQLNVTAKIVRKDGSINYDEMNRVLKAEFGVENVSVAPDIYLKNYAPQSPVTDSMRTMLFNLPKVTDSMWNELSPWNRSFAKKIKKDSIKLATDKEGYVFRYILQKDKKAPLAVIYPSTGDGVNANHPTMFAKLFYDAGYSVIIQGNPFQWEFVKSMPDSYKPGCPMQDAMAMREATYQIIRQLEKKYSLNFDRKVIFGTSLAGFDVLYMAEQESKENILGNTQFIAICPPVDLLYSVNQVDTIMGDWQKFSDDLKNKVAYTSAKIVKLYQSRKDINFLVNKMPFDEDEAQLITGFMMHQKLSDVIFTIEKAPDNKHSNIYEMIYNMNFKDYFEKYIIPDENIKSDYKKRYALTDISDFLYSADNYKIYHTTNDYLINKHQLKQLKFLTGKNLVILDNGSHMGFLYRAEFLKDFNTTISKLKQLH